MTQNKHYSSNSINTEVETNLLYYYGSALRKNKTDFHTVASKTGNSDNILSRNTGDGAILKYR